MDFVIDGPHYSLSTRFLMIAAIVCIAALLLNAIRIIHSVKGILRLKKSEERLKDSVIRLDFPFFKSEPGEPLSVDISGDVQGIGIQIDRILKNFQYQIAKRIGFFQFFLFMSLIMGILSIHFSWVMFDHYYQSTGVKEFQFFIRDCMKMVLPLCLTLFAALCGRLLLERFRVWMEWQLSDMFSTIQLKKLENRNQSER